MISHELNVLYLRTKFVFPGVFGPHISHGRLQESSRLVSIGKYERGGG